MKEQNQQHQQFNNRLQRLRELVVLLFACVFFGYIFSSCTKPEDKKETVTPTLPSSSDIAKTMANDMQGVDFSKFMHDSPQHARLTCLLCHERKDDSPKPKLANHQTCSACHAQQFEDKNSAICSTCHTNKEKPSEVKDFPPLKSFNVQFNHQAHFKETNCATCHQSQNGGGMTKPAGGDAHATCFQCHTSEKIVGDKNIGSCSTCHQAGTPNRIVDTAQNIGFNFNHSKHSGLNCNSCHNATGDNQMSAIKVGMHAGQANSCATCHNEQKAFGANDFSDCRKCHQEVAGAKTFGVKFNHGDHAKQNCATCHKSGGSGVTFSIPNGQTAHNTCFQCHSPNKDSGSFTSSKCFQCHQAGNSNNISASTPVIAGNFNHTKHKSMSCNSCHNVKGGNISAPTVAMHKAQAGTLSCASCHNNQKAFGTDNFSDCKRCHTNNNFKF